MGYFVNRHRITDGHKKNESSLTLCFSAAGHINAIHYISAHLNTSQLHFKLIPPGSCLNSVTYRPVRSNYNTKYILYALIYQFSIPGRQQISLL